MKSSAPSRQGFTLLELLLVLSVMSILTTFCVLAIRTGSTNLAAAQDQVNGVLAFARQEAITRNTLCAVVLVTTTANDDLGYKTLGVYELRPTDGVAPSSSDWVQAGKWQTLPQGIAVDNTSTASSFLQATSVAPPLPTLAFRGDQLNPATDCAVQIFMPSGRLSPPPTDPCTMRLVEGSYAPNATTITYTHRNASAQPADYVSYILSTATGEAKIVRP